MVTGIAVIPRFAKHYPPWRLITFLAVVSCMKEFDHVVASYFQQNFQQTISSSGPDNYQQNQYASGRSSMVARKGIRFDDDIFSKHRPGISEQPGFNPRLIMTEHLARPVEYPEDNYVPNYSFSKKNHHGLTQKERKSCGVPGAGAFDELVSSPSSLTRIVGGVEAIPNQICWQVKLSYKGSFFCGGSIIGKRTILTANHCVLTNGILDDPKYYTVQVGAMNSNVTEQTKDPRSCFQELKVVKIIPNIAYNDTTVVNDITLLTLDADIDFSKPCACPICLRPWIPSVGEICAASGYGREAEGIDVRDPTPLKVVHIDIVQTNLLHCPIMTNGTDLDNFLCAGDVRGEDTCQGDSGGALVCLDVKTRSYYQVGITSSGDGCARGRIAGVYTRVSRYLDWIRRNAQDKSVSFSTCMR